MNEMKDSSRPDLRLVASGRHWGGQDAIERDGDRRERLMDAALRLFSERGYKASSMRDLCATSGVSSKHFYRLFSNREALLTALYERILQKCMASLQRTLDNSDWHNDSGISDAVAAFFVPLLKDPRQAQITLIECVGISDDLEQRRRESHNEMAKMIEWAIWQLIETGDLPPDEPGYAPVAFIGALNEVVVEWLHRGQPISAQELIREHICVVTQLMVLGSRERNRLQAVDEA